MWSCASNTSEKIRKAMDMRLYEIWHRTNDHPCIGRVRLIVTAVFMAKCKCMEPPCVQNLTQKRRLHIISSWSSCMCALTSCASIRSDKRYLRPWDLWSTHRISCCRTFSCFETRPKWPKWPKLQWTSFSYNLQLQFSSLNFNSRPPPHGGVWVLFRKDGLNNPSIQWDVPGWESLTKHTKSVPSEPMTNVQTLHSSVFHADRSSCDNLLFSSLTFLQSGCHPRCCMRIHFSCHSSVFGFCRFPSTSAKGSLARKHSRHVVIVVLLCRIVVLPPTSACSEE